MGGFGLIMQTTVGQLLINDILPDDLKSYSHNLDKGGITKLFRDIATKHPDKYREIAQKFMELGHYNAQASGASLSLSALLPPPHVQQELEKLQALVEAISYSNMPDEKKEKKIVDLVANKIDPLKQAIYDHGLATDNPFAIQVKSGSRGNEDQLKQLVVGDMLVKDHRDRVIPVPVLHGYAHGVDPAEYWAASYGARRGSISTKFATQDAGFFGKQLVMTTHRLVVSDKKPEKLHRHPVGVIVDANDSDNAGALLAQDVDGYPAGTILTPEILKQLGDKKILLRSPITSHAPDGIYAEDAGIREKGRLPEIGDNIGVAAAQAIGEKMAQGMLSEKHGGGSVGGKQERNFGGFGNVNQLIQVPTAFRNGATISHHDGTIQKVEDAPQGGKYIFVANQPHYVQPDMDIHVKPGDRVEAGDVMSEGVVNPAEIVTHKGIGEGRVAWVKAMMRSLKDSRINPHRRNLEVISRGLINHVRVTDLDGHLNALPDDVLPYDYVARTYQPRPGAVEAEPHRSINKYLEEPALHFTIGTRITPRVADTLKDFGIKQVHAHSEPPPFEPEMIRAMNQPSADQNWMSRLGGSYLERGLLQATHRGMDSKIHETSFIPSLAEAKNFGKDLKTKAIY
jgi:DNA-directed RNA polymerase subunit beta'